MNQLKWLFLIIGLITVIVTFLYLQIRDIEVKKYNLYFENLPPGFDGFTILQLSDLHSKWFGDNQKELIDLINEHDHDIIAITGDLVNKRNPIVEPVADLMNQLKERPVYFVPGNHDWWTGFQTKKLLSENGVPVLLNTSTKIVKDDQHIWLAGVDDPYLGRADLNACLEGIKDDSTKVLLSHSPDIFPEAVEKKLDLVLVGHTHGGQVRLPVIGALIVPGQGLFPKWDYGVFKSKETIMVINSGLGESGLPIRFNIKPEIVLVTLHSAKAKQPMNVLIEKRRKL